MDIATPGDAAARELTEVGATGDSTADVKPKTHGRAIINHVLRLLSSSNGLRGRFASFEAMPILYNGGAVMELIHELNMKFYGETLHHLLDMCNEARFFRLSTIG